MQDKRKYVNNINNKHNILYFPKKKKKLNYFKKYTN